jgi:predicted PurR-regulated permease PerM
MNTKVNPKYFFFGCLFAALVLVVLIFLPFMTVFILGAAVAVVFHPLYRRFNKAFPWQTGWLSALITVICFIFIVCAPLMLMGRVIIHQASDLYVKVSATAGADGYGSYLSDAIGKYVPESLVSTAEAKLASLAETVASNLSGLFTATIATLFDFLLLILSVFYFLKDGSRWKKAIIALSPLSDSDDEKILGRLRDAISGVMRGYLLIALAQGVLMGIGLAVFHVPNPALLGAVAAIASLIPSVGTALVAVPIIAFLFFTGHPNAALGFAAWAGVLVGTIDNILNPVLVGARIRIPPLLILFSVLGGISFMGPVGILIGPVSVSLLFALLSIYSSKFEQEEIV